MFRRVFASLIIVFFTLSVQAQEKQRKVRRPDLPGSFIIEFGFNSAQGGPPSKFEQGFWGSRTLNLYYQYPIRIWKTKFSFNPGLGFSLERYKLTNNYTLARKPDADGTFPLVPAKDLDMPNTDKSMFIMNYLDFMPAEIRFDTKPDDPARSFHVTAGVRVGLLFDTHTKVNFSEGGENKTFKDEQQHGLNSFRYGLYSRIGVGSLSLFGYYNMTPVFQDNKGPEKTTMSTLTIGLSLRGF